MARSALAELGPDGAALLSADLLHIWASPDVAVDAETRSAALRAGLAMPPGQLRDDALSAALAEDGELLADEPYAEWAIRVRERYETLCQEARLALARDRAMGAGRSGRDDALAAWQSCLDHDPASEEAAGALIRAYLAQGRPELAARVFERCRVALEQLGLRISPSLERIYAPARDPGPARAAVPLVPATAQPPPWAAARLRLPPLAWPRRAPLVWPACAPSAVSLAWPRLPPQARPRRRRCRGRSAAPSACCSPRWPPRPGWPARSAWRRCASSSAVPWRR